MKIDPYKHEKSWNIWKAKVINRIPEINEVNSGIIKRYLSDMEQGINISDKNIKGSRSYSRLNNLKQRMIFLTKEFELRFEIKSLFEIIESNLHEYFSAIRKGKIRTRHGKIYKSVADYVKVFKAFWHWHIKVSKKEGIIIDDITTDLDTSRNKPKWVYMDESQLREFADNAKYEYRVLIMFLFDTGIRAPTELMNIRVSDIFNDYKELQITEEASKTFGRRIKLMLCSKIIKEYIKINNLKSNDLLFQIKPSSVNKYLKRRAKSLFGEEVSLGGEFFKNITMYDFRHISCCYWLPRYPTESAIKYRFGWKRSEKIHYYSEMLGMKDTIKEEDIFIDITKTQLEQKLEITHKENQKLKEEVDSMKMDLKKILEHLNNMGAKI